MLEDKEKLEVFGEAVKQLASENASLRAQVALMDNELRLMQRKLRALTQKSATQTEA